VDTAYVSTKPPPNKRVLLSLEEVEISELPEDERSMFSAVQVLAKGLALLMRAWP
jgi:hypothetical protein